jgi:hemoglobin-like flavoprotein
MSLDIDVLRDSFALVAERETAVALRFYEILFERYPQTRSMFRRSSVEQAQMLTQALVAVVEHLEDSTWLGSTLHALGAKHVEYRVRDEMYDWVGECLIAALEDCLGPAFSPRVKLAWIGAYGAVAGLMKAGAASVISSQSRPPGSMQPARPQSSSA